MPPRSEVTKEKVLSAAFELVRKQGFEALSARNIAETIGCSTQPIYSLFNSIDELKERIYDKAAQYARDCMLAYQDSDNSPALNVTIGFLHFAQEEKFLFRTLYLTGYKTYNPHTDEFLGEELMSRYLRYSKRLNYVSDEQMKRIFLKLTIYLIGIGTLLNSRTLELDMDEATGMIREMYEMLLQKEGLTYEVGNKEGNQ
ncbi:TetR/AcrR family transcriptional regulator [Paenibacillus paeoniae]|uniref:TetR/AcrR family transcriptional regulator n=1 Tax=Paenibacillus paeoniae TaxID=2292705 RepID=A0A371PM28_9BACL|nr:TetR/AcrR family transcriptional regulator [Paenibacillus paeoniae]REK76817.1 TetR/AcrR family transcriptional regulator [Paenibacillus paeoniae]